MAVAAVNQLTTEKAIQDIMGQWLKGYFDGQPHNIGSDENVPMPKCSVSFGQGQMTQPLSATENPEQVPNVHGEIRMVIEPKGKEREDNMPEEAGKKVKLVNAHVTLRFWVRAADLKNEKAQYTARDIADKLKAILDNPDSRYPLSRLGITHLDTKQAQLVPSNDYAMRQVACDAQIQYKKKW